MEEAAIGRLGSTAAFSRWPGEVLFGFLYWLAFLLVLEPGNILGAMQERTFLAWDQESIRIIGASTLGATVTPLLLALVRRFPVEGAARRRHAALLFAISLLTAAGLILLSCILAPLLLRIEHRPFAQALANELAVNGPLVFFVVAALIGIAHAVRFAGRVAASDPCPQESVSAPLRAVAIKSRGTQTMLDVSEVDWIETQGNYLALHVGPAVHLIRQTSVRFESMIDARQFLRIHRQTIVAIDRIRALETLTNGDAMLRLKDGTELRVSRSFREPLRAALDARARPDQSLARST